MEIGRYSPTTAKWVIASIKQMQKRMAAFATIKQVRAIAGVSHDHNAIHVENTDAEDAPPYACMQVVGRRNPPSDRRDYLYLQVQRPTDQYGVDGWYVFNGPETIAADGFGVAYAQEHARVYGVTGSVGDRLLPKIDSWQLTKDPTGWMVLIGSDDVYDDTYRILNCPMTGRAWFKTPGGGIDAATGGTSGKAECDLMIAALDGSGDSALTYATDENAAQITHYVHNRSAGAVGGTVEIQAFLINGIWFSNWEDC